MLASSATVEPARPLRGSESDISEISLLLPTWQIECLSKIAQQRGMNVGQLLRGMIREIVPAEEFSAN
jgi:hypothetical protein